MTEQFGHADFRQGQRVLIEYLLEGEDVLGVLATGAGTAWLRASRLSGALAAHAHENSPGRACARCTLAGKSLPGEFFAAYRRTAVLMLQPLTALLAHSEQMSKIRSYHFGPGYASKAELLDLARERPSAGVMLRTTPEWALAHLNALAQFHRECGIGAIVVDEAHLVASWGESFRPSLASIARLRDVYAYACTRYLRKIWSTNDYWAWVCVSPLQSRVLSLARCADSAASESSMTTPKAMPSRRPCTRGSAGRRRTNSELFIDATHDETSADDVLTYNVVAFDDVLLKCTRRALRTGVQGEQR